MSGYKRLFFDSIVFWVVSGTTWAFLRYFGGRAPFGWLMTTTTFLTLIAVRTIAIRYGSVTLWSANRKESRRGFEVVPTSGNPNGAEDVPCHAGSRESAGTEMEGS